jgi:hypothetical protein
MIDSDKFQLDGIAFRNRGGLEIVMLMFQIERIVSYSFSFLLIFYF